MKKLILITNDDGIKSPGLLAVAKAMRGLGELVVVAPAEQQSSAGRAFYWEKRPPKKSEILIGRQRIPAHAVSASPAVAVRYGLMLVAKHKPDLVVSGINYGENLGNGVTISGTVGAALEAAADGVPALAVSLETDKQYHNSHSKDIDFKVAAFFAHQIAERILSGQLPPGAPLLNVNVPRGATRSTPWRVTSLSHQAYFRSMVTNGRFVGYDVQIDRERLERNSDIYALLVDHIVSVTPLTYDMTARVSRASIARALSKDDE